MSKACDTMRVPGLSSLVSFGISFWFSDVGFGVENHGTDPDVEVDNAPQDAAAGRDRQLETALKTALDCADQTAPLRAPQATRPVRARKPLPPRR